MKKAIFCLTATALAIVVNIGLWAWLGRVVTLPDVPDAHFDCLSYTAFEIGSDPRLEKDHVSAATLDADMKALRPLTNCLRLYSSMGSAPDVLAVAERYGFHILLGIWISSNEKSNAEQVAAALALTARYPETIKLLVVGNEVLLRRDLPASRLITLINSVRAQSPVPVAYAEVYDFWMLYPDVAKSVDTLLVHILPYWGDPAPDVSKAIGQLHRELKKFISAFPDKKIMLGETGWPSVGPSRGAAHASRVDEARFIRGFIQEAHRLGVQYNLIEALDQPWKRADEGTAGGYWGLLTAEREQKFPLTGPVSEWPQWRILAGIAVLLGLLMGSIATFRATTTCRLFPVALSAQALGTVLLVGFCYAKDVVLGWLAAGLYCGAWLLTLLTGLAILDFFARGMRAWVAEKPAPLRNIFRAIGQCAGDGAARRRITGLLSNNATQISSLHFAVAFPVAALTLTLAVSARHRDVPDIFLLVPAAFSLILGWINWRHRSLVRGAEEAWLALLMLTSAVFAWWALGCSVESTVWSVAVLLLAAPWLASLIALFRRPQPARQ